MYICIICTVHLVELNRDLGVFLGEEEEAAMHLPLDCLLSWRIGERRNLHEGT